jgi:hypothetical protein
VKPERKVNANGEVIEIDENGVAVVVEEHPIYEYLYDYVSSEP